MNDLTLRQLEYFVAVAETGSVSAAARTCRVSAGGMSLALSDLESSLGMQLMLRRKSKGTELTPAGRAIALRAQRLLQDARQLQLSAKILQGELVGSLRIGCFATLSPWLVPRIIEFFARRHPSVEIEVLEGSSDELLGRMMDGELDACLLYSLHLQPEFDAVELAEVRLRLLLHPEHRLARSDAVALQDLGDEPAVLLDLKPARDLVVSFMRAAGFEPNIRWRSTNTETIRSMVARGVAYSVLMGRPEGDRSYDGLPLAYLRIADPLPENRLVVALPRGLEPNAKVRELIRFSRREFGELDERLR